MPIIPKVALDALALKKYFKKNTVEPENVYERIHQSEKSKKWVYTFQASFESKKQVEIFQKMNNVINTGLFED